MLISIDTSGSSRTYCDFMGRKSRVAATLSIGTLTLTGCVSNIDVPETFPATVTVIGNAERAEPGTGQCIVGTIPLAPNDIVFVLGESAAASARSALEVDSVERNVDGTGVCTYVAHFEAIPANQRSYTVTVSSEGPSGGTFESQFSSDDLIKGATVYLHESMPSTDIPGG